MKLPNDWLNSINYLEMKNCVSFGVRYESNS